MTQIILERLCKSFATQQAPVLNNFSLEVNSGELLALLGPSGSGKSTILKLIAGIEQLDSGDIRFDERSLLEVPAHQRGAVLMFQKAYLFPFLNVADNIGFGLKMQGLARSIIKSEVGRMLELVELPGVEHKYPAQLSGGQQQRVALARALVVKPRVLMLDEPLSNLDTAVRQTLQQAIRRIQRELRITTLLVTHDLTEAITMSDRTALLLNGVVAACDQPRQLFERPPTRATAQFVGVSTFLSGCYKDGSFVSQLGTFTAPGASGDQRETYLAIRPEHIRLSETDVANTTVGKIHDVAYSGEFTAYDVVCGPIMVKVKTYGTAKHFDVGEQVYVQLPAEHLFEVA